MSFRLFTFLAFWLLLSSCSSRSSTPVSSSLPDHPPFPSSLSGAPHSSLATCGSFPDHYVLAVVMDGMEVGREVRSVLSTQGPFGDERVLLSHMSLRMRMGSIPFDTQSVRLLKFSQSEGFLLFGSQVDSDPLKSSTSVVGFDGASWARRIDAKSSYRDTPSSFVDLDLSRVDVYGFDLIDRLARQVASPSKNTLYFYEPVLAAPIELQMGDPLPSSISLSDKVVDGTWVEARRKTDQYPVVRVFVARDGKILQEEYPALSQIRRRTPIDHAAPVPSDLPVGLFSSSYSGDSSSSTRAIFTLRAASNRLDSLRALGEAAGQKLSRTSPTESALEVLAMAPDGQSPPVPADLSEDAFINARAPSILSALQYLRSAGKSGKLNPQRTLNATSIIADLSLRPSFKSIWSDPEKLAVLLARYVSALLPNKEHTFSMVDAVTALEKGFGDCTEHSVLLASFLRAEKIPSRLVSGMLLTHGGLWIYHMWIEYWDGSSWQAIDASRPPFKTDAMYVSIGRGASRFTDSRSNLSRFIESAFSGVSFDLVAAWADGMNLPLSHPKRVDVRSNEAIVLESMVLSRRGDWTSALNVLDSGISKEASTLSQKLLRLEYLTFSGRCDEALSDAAALLKTTSARENLLSIRLSEINCHIRLGHIQKSREVLKELRKMLPKDDVKVSLLDSQIFALENGPSSSRALLEALLQSNPGCLPCLAAHANTMLDAEDPSPGDLALALSETLKVLDLVYWADVEPLLSFSKLLTLLSHPREALFVLDHALLLRPLDPQLLSLRDQSNRAFCGSP